MDPDGSDLRRSVRERRATTVKYNGFTVKVNNQYTLEEGERSVFDEEMGEVMVMDSNKYDRPLEKKPVVQRVPRVMSKEEKGRKDSNDQLKAITERLEQRRRFWLRCHLPKLEGWVPEKELRKLREDRSLDHAPEAVERLEEQPESIRGVMKEYQLKGISFMARMVSDGVGCILADEMGLGKTLQTIALIAWMKIHRKEPGPCLVVVPLSVISSWIAEFKKWCPTLKVARLHSSDQSYHQELARNVLTVGEDSPDVVLTTYDMVKSMQMLTMKLNWRLLVLDEGHLIKNDQTGRAAALRRVRACSTVLLTGTPLQNNLVELWALLSFLNPIFTDKTPFESAFTLGVVHNADTQAMDGCSSLLRLFCLRRVKREVEVNLPPLIETRVECPLSSLQTFWYRRLLLREYQTLLKKVETDEGGASASAAGDTDTQETGAWKKLQALFIQLRKCCNHPYLFPSAEPFFDGSTGEDLVEASGKLAVLDRLLAQLYAGGHRVVLFSQFKMMLDIFEDMLQMRGYDGKYMRLDGSTGRVQRTVDIAEFNRPRKDGSAAPFLYMLCTRAGGLGVNLQTADTVILYDSDWNPQVDLQAIARVHRIGQQRPVAALRLVTAGSVEQRMVERAEKKLYLDAMVSRGSTAESDTRDTQKEKDGVDNKELLGALMFGTDRLFSTDSGAMPTEAELAALLVAARDPSKKAAGGANMAEVKKTADDFDATGGYTVDASADVRNDLIMKAMGTQAEQLGMKKGVSDKDIAKQAAIAMEAKAKLKTTDEKRESKARLVMVKDDHGKTHQVLRSNMYSLEQGEPSVLDREAKPSTPVVRSRQMAGKDYPHSEVCQVCWEKEDYWLEEFGAKKSTFLLCRGCPVACHVKCLEEYDNASAWIGNSAWTCPHHKCESCHISASAAGGLLFRCECCWRALCEDHLPEQAEEDTATADGWHPVGRCERFEALGQRHPTQAYFITCDPDCRKYCEDNINLFRMPKPKPGDPNHPLSPPPLVPKPPPPPCLGPGSTKKHASLATLAGAPSGSGSQQSPGGGGSAMMATRVKPAPPPMLVGSSSRASRALKRTASEIETTDAGQGGAREAVKVQCVESVDLTADESPPPEIPLAEPVSLAEEAAAEVVLAAGGDAEPMEEAVEELAAVTEEPAAPTEEPAAPTEEAAPTGEEAAMEDAPKEAAAAEASAEPDAEPVTATDSKPLSQIFAVPTPLPFAESTDQ